MKGLFKAVQEFNTAIFLLLRGNLFSFRVILVLFFRTCLLEDKRHDRREQGAREVKKFFKSDYNWTTKPTVSESKFSSVINYPKHCEYI